MDHQTLTDEQIAQAAKLARADLYAEHRLGIKLHPKQRAVLVDTFKPKSHVVARCGNEVGKTSTIATGAILYAIEILGAEVISTAGVWMQVETQLIPSLKRHAHLYPGWRFLDDCIKVGNVQRYTGFSTRDEGFAQGFHRRPGKPLLAIIDEAAAVSDAVFAGVEDRCNPDFLLVMGSPLNPSGMFYRMQTDLRKFYTVHHINQMDCLTTAGYWLDPESIERKIAKWGMDHPLVRSNVFGEFPDQVEGALLSIGELESALANPPLWGSERQDRHGFLDFAAGRNKNVFAVRVGNKVWIEKKWTDKNTMSAVGEFLATFRRLETQYGLRPEECEGDADGLGLPMIQRLREVGFNLASFHGGSAPVWEKHYANRISEAWGELAGRMKRKLQIFPDDLDFKGQMLSRKMKPNSSGKTGLESKEDMIKRGIESPDEADAVAGASMPMLAINSIQVMGTHRDELPGRKSELEGEAEERQQVLPGAFFG